MRSAVFIFAAFVLFSSCRFNGFKRINGNGIAGRQERTVSDFSNLRVSGSVDVFISQATAPSVRIEGDENLLSYIEVRNEGNRLLIAARNGYNLNPKAGLKVYVAGPVFEDITITGSCDLKSENKIKSNRIGINITGSGDAALQVNSPVVKASISGSGSLRLNGETENFESHINGSGELYAYDLLSENTIIKIAGSGDAQVFASKQLKINIAGAGDVGYKGTANVTQSVAGSGDIHKED
jgi:hypothetical protein